MQTIPDEKGDEFFSLSSVANLVIFTSAKAKPIYGCMGSKKWLQLGKNWVLGTPMLLQCYCCEHTVFLSAHICMLIYTRKSLISLAFLLISEFFCFFQGPAGKRPKTKLPTLFICR